MSKPDSQTTTEKPLGRWHRWWLKQFKEAWAERNPAKQRGGGIFVGLPQGKIQGRALCDLLDMKLIALETSFDSGGLLHITEKGLKS